MKRYKVTFYQCGVEGFDPEFYKTKRAAMLAACEFLACMLPMPGHKRTGSMYRDNYARIQDYCGATEAMAEVHNLTRGENET